MRVIELRGNAPSGNALRVIETQPSRAGASPPWKSSTTFHVNYAGGPQDLCPASKKVQFLAVKEYLKQSVFCRPRL